MPRIHLSDRRVEGAMPQTRTFQPQYAETLARTTGALGRQIVNDINHSISVINSIKERDAEIAATEWEATMMKGLNGYVETDAAGNERRVPGFAQKTWDAYPKDGSQSPITDLSQLEKDFQNSETFKGMDAVTRTKFNRRIQIRRQQYQLKANELYDRNREARDRFYDAAADKNDDTRLELAIYGDDDSFESTLREVAAAKTDRKFRKLDRNDPRVASAYNTALLDETRKAAMGRVVALAADGAAGEPKFVSGKLETGDESIRRAENYLDKLTTSGRITAPESKALAFKIISGRTQLENRIEREIRNATESAQLKAYEKDGLAGIEQTKAMLELSAKGLRKGSSVQNAALAAAQKLDQTADKRVQFDIMNDLANGKNLLMSDGKTPIFDPNSRQARLFPAVYQAFTEKQQKAFNKGFRAAREQNLLAVEGKMMEFAAEGNPQGFYGYLADQVVAKKLTAGDFTRLRDKFNDGWMKGFKGSPDQLARQTSMAKNMLGLLNDRLGVDFSEAVKKDDYGDPVLKNGTIDFDDKKELPTAEVKRQFKKTVRHGDIFLSFGSDIGTRKEEISGEQLKGIINQAMNIWSCNGMKITYDPVTGEDLPDGKTHTVNAERDFAALLDRVADEKNVLSAAQTLKNQAAYAANVRMQAQTDADRRQKKMTGSTPVTDKALEDTDE